MKVVINKCFGGFSLSEEGMKRYRELSGNHDPDILSYDIERDDEFLVQVVEEMGKKSWGSCAELKVVDIPLGIRWHISNYDGMESVEEEHRSWG